MKRRERNFRHLGGTEEQYEVFLNSNRTSLKFSIFVSVVMLIISLSDFGGVVVCLATNQLDIVLTLNLGQCAGLMFAIPFIMLFSFTRKHDDSLDIIVVLFGIALIVLTYIEMGYQIDCALARTE